MGKMIDIIGAGAGRLLACNFRAVLMNDTRPVSAVIGRAVEVP